MKDLTTEEGRILEVRKIEESFLKSLRDNNFEVCPSAVCYVTSRARELGIASEDDYKNKGYKMAFASEISISATYNSFSDIKGNEINFGSSGSFTPSVKESYWRTIHAASILKNWETAIIIVNSHCKMLADLEKEIITKKEKK